MVLPSSGPHSICNSNMALVLPPRSTNCSRLAFSDLNNIRRLRTAPTTDKIASLTLHNTAPRCRKVTLLYSLLNKTDPTTP